MMRWPILLLSLTAALAVPAAAQTWPEKPVRLIVPTGPGSATDLMARLMASEVEKAIGGPVFVDDIPGASGIPAHQAAARAAPDGYTFLFTNTSGMATNLVSFKTLPYNPQTDFSAVAMVADLAPQMVSVNKKVAAKTLPELIALAKASPGKLDYGVDATAGAGVFSGRMLNRRAAMEMSEVAYKSGPQMAQDAASGQIPVLVSSIAAAQVFVDSGDIRPLAVFSGRRFPGMPDLPMVSESVPGAMLDGFFVVVAPAGAPAAIVEKFNRAVDRFLRTPDAPKRLNALGLATSGAGTPASTAAFIAGEQKRWRDLAGELGIEPQ